jgi:hypothetical protein
MPANEFEAFLNKLIYFGGNLGIRPPLKEYTDIEEFIIDASKFMSHDTRARQCFYNWLHQFAPYISPSKLRRIIKVKKYNSKELAVFVEILETHPLNSQNWKILKPFCEGNSIKKFIINKKKYLKTNSYILKKCPELKYRVDGNNPVAADLKAYLQKNKKFQSLYMLAKETFNPRNRINYEYELLAYIKESA